MANILVYICYLKAISECTKRIQVLTVKYKVFLYAKQKYF